MKTLILPPILLAGALLAGCNDNPTDPAPEATVVSAAGNITAAVTQYRAVLGEPLNTTPGPHAEGRREINWDGVPDALSAPFDLPGDFFNSTDPAAPGGRKRGAVFTTPGSAVQVSAATGNASGAALRFGNINAAYAQSFQAFSEERLFAPVGSNLVDVTFFVPGTSTPAVVRGFGAVFTDVDRADVTALVFYDAAGRLLGRFAAPAANNGLSFLGVAFPTALVHRVRIEHGNAALGPADGGQTDVVVTDDFFYDEPRPIQ